MAGKFEVYEDPAGRFRFRLKASNGEVVAQDAGIRDGARADGYPSKASAREACESILAAADGAPIVEVEK